MVGGVGYNRIGGATPGSGDVIGGQSGAGVVLQGAGNYVQGDLIGTAPEGWPGAVRLGAILAMPLGEVAIALALIAPRTRTIGLIGSVVQHGATIAILGPWALDHSAIVLTWNAALIVENLLLFRGGWAPGPRSILAASGLTIALVVGERWGLADSWPAHALYASHAERTTIDWPAGVALPPSVGRWLGPPDSDGRRRLDLTGWSRAERGVPVYPQNRVACAVAEALVARFLASDGPPVRVVLYGRAGVARNSRRGRVECVDLPSLRRRGDRSWINAHPASGYGRGSE